MKPWTPIAKEIFCSASVRASASSDLIAVCVSTFNYGRYLADCLDSVYGQTHEAIELIIVDDASNDGVTLQIAEDWLKKKSDRFHRSVLLSHTRNQGPSSARNTAVDHSKAEYLFILDADNILYPRAISRLFDALISGSFSAVYPQLEFFGDEQRLGYADVWDVEALIAGNYVDATALMTRSAWSSVDGYSHIEEGWEDYDFWLKLAGAKIQVGFVPQILCRYRVHKASRTAVDAHVAHERLRRIIAMRHFLP